MKEQVPYNVTPEQGWSSMKSILDQEMPVRHQRRRFAFWWWSAGLIVLAGLGGYAAWSGMTTSVSGQRVPATPPAEKKEVPPAPDAYTANTNHSTPTIQPGESQKGLYAEGSEPVPASEEHKSGPPLATPAVHKVIKNTSSASKAMAANTTVSNPVIPGAMSAADLPGTVITQPSMVDPTPQDPLLVAREDGRNGQVFFRIPSLALAPMDTETEPAIPVLHKTSEPVRSAKRSVLTHFHPYVAADGLSGFSGGGGYMIQGGVEMALSSRFQLRAGAGFRTFDPGLSLFSGSHGGKVENADLTGFVQNDNSIPGIYEYVNAAAVNSNSSYANLQSILETLHQWDIRAGASWNMNSRFYLESGAALSVLSSATSEYPIVTLNTAIPSGDVKVTRSLDEYHVIRRHMISCFAGIGYRLGRHLSLYGQAQFAFKSYILSAPDIGLGTSDQSRDDYLSGIAMGLKYAF